MLKVYKSKRIYIYFKQKLLNQQKNNNNYIQNKNFILIFRVAQIENRSLFIN